MENNLETQAISHCFKYLSWDINVPIQGYKRELEGAVEENSKRKSFFSWNSSCFITSVEMQKNIFIFLWFVAR